MPDPDAAPANEVSVSAVVDGVAAVELHRPPNNFFDAALIAQLADACEELASAGECRAVVLCSEGRNFCAGANLVHRNPLDAQQGPHLYDEARRLFGQPLPVVAAVQGAAIGGGLGLALAADFRVAAPESRFAANFALLGFHHGFAMTLTLPAIVGQQAALDLLYTGRRIGGEEAHRIGLCDRLVRADTVRTEAHRLAAEIAAAAPLAVRAIRHTMRRTTVAQVEAAMDHERAEQEHLMLTEDWREGVAAVGERRPARFVGR